MTFIGFDDVPTHSRHAPVYDLRAESDAVPPEYRGSYEVRAADGAVVAFYLATAVYDHVPQVDSATALATAQEFGRRHYPAFRRGQWQLESPRFRDGQYAWEFRWYRVVDSRWGTRAVDYLGVRVEYATGRVTGLIIPDDEVTGPTAPNVSHAEALRLARQVCPVSPAQAPFRESWLEMAGQDEQWPEWRFLQYTDDEDSDTYYTDVDALTGEASTPVPLDGVLGGKKPSFQRPSLPTGFRWPKPRRTSVRLTSGDGKSLEGTYPPEVRQGRIWARVETLEVLGVILRRRPHGFTLYRRPDRQVESRELGAFKRENGWWIPVRETARRLGWTVRWRPRPREVIIPEPRQAPVDLIERPIS